jgi:hypothetical protein
MAASAFLNGSSLGFGGTTHTSLTAKLITRGGKQVDTAELNAEATADGSVLATTTLFGSVEAGDDGSGVLVVTYTSGIGAGEDAHSESFTRSFAISTPGPDIGFGMTRSIAWGEESHDAVASVEVYGDITNSHSMEGDNGQFSWAFSVGVTIDFA